MLDGPLLAHRGVGATGGTVGIVRQVWEGLDQIPHAQGNQVGHLDHWGIGIDAHELGFAHQVLGRIEDAVQPLRNLVDVLGTDRGHER